MVNKFLAFRADGLDYVLRLLQHKSLWHSHWRYRHILQAPCLVARCAGQVHMSFVMMMVVAVAYAVFARTRTVVYDVQ